MSGFLKVTVTFSDRTTEVIFSSKRFYHYVIETAVKQWRESGRTPIMFEASELTDEVIIECIKHKESNFPIEKARENLPNYDD